MFRFKIPLHNGPVALLAAAMLVFGGDAAAQVPGLKNLLEAPAEAKPAAENPAETKTRLLEWQKDARGSLARLDDPSSSGAFPAGISSGDVEERRRDNEQIVMTVDRYIKLLEAVKNAGESVAKARETERGWTGFTETPPFSLLMADDLLNEQDAVMGKISSLESSQTVFRRTLANLLMETRTTEEMVKSLAVEASKPGDGAELIKWRYEAQRAKSRALAARASFIDVNCDLLELQINEAKAENSLLTRKIRTTKARAVLSDEDLAKIEAGVQKRIAAIRKELIGITKRQNAATASQKQARAALEALVPATPEAAPPTGLELARFRVELADDRVDSLQAIAEALEGLVQLENVRLSAYQDRKAWLGSGSPADRQKALAALGVLLDRLGAWEVYLENNATTDRADLNQLDSRAATIPAEDPRAALFVERKTFRLEKQALYQRLSQSITSQRTLVGRWVEEFTPKQDDQSVYHAVTSFVSETWETLKRIWAFEVMKGEDITLEVDGVVQTVSTSVTLGVLLRALIFFVIGYWILAAISNRIQGTVIRRGHIAEAQARTLRNWAMIVVGVGLAITTLSLLKIPLTIFAFFGGALAIGLGFGSQTLIKNFICGIIVLFERKVRVGDVVDVGGVTGSITEINTRSSVLRGPDGRETLVPNSVFLETSVTNLTLVNRTLRRFVNVGVAYGTSPGKVSKILMECAERHGLIQKDPAPLVIFQDFGDNALLFRLYFWVTLEGKTNPELVESDIRIMIEKSFSESGIAFPFPQRDMHLKTDAPIQVSMSVPAPTAE